MDGDVTASMPPPAPLAHPRQDLSRGFRDVAAPAGLCDPAALIWRAAVFTPAALATGALL